METANDKGAARSQWWGDASASLDARRVSFVMTLGLTILWVLVFNDFSWLTVLSGLMIALVVQVAFPLPHVSRTWRMRPLRIMYLVWVFLLDVVRSGFLVAKLVIQPRGTRSAVLRVKLRSRDVVHMTIVSAMTNLVPGTIVLRVDRLTGNLYLHVLDLDAQGGASAVRTSVRDQEARLLYAIAPSELLEQVGLDGLALQGLRGHRREESASLDTSKPVSGPAVSQPTDDAQSASEVSTDRGANS